MKNRYENLTSVYDLNYKKVRQPISFIPEIPKYSDDIYFKTVGGDRFDLLSTKYYSNPGYYWIIQRANNIYGTMFPEVGIVLRIPSPNRLLNIKY